MGSITCRTLLPPFDNARQWGIAGHPNPSSPLSSLSSAPFAAQYHYVQEAGKKEGPFSRNFCGFGANGTLLDRNLRAAVFQLLLEFRSVVLGNIFLDRLGKAFDQVLGFLETQTGDFAHDLDDIDLLGGVEAI